jgi:hypothetical protein
LPPLFPVAVKVTAIPWHTGFDEEVMLMLTGKVAAPVSVIEFDVTGFGPFRHDELDVSLQVTMFPVTGEKVKVGWLVPALTPFTVH